MRDRLILLASPFSNPAYPGRLFYCRHCCLLEGMLSSFWHCASGLEVERVEWARPRDSVVALLGEENQSLPVLILQGGGPCVEEAATYKGTRFISVFEQILHALTRRHGFPEAHP
jgi:hypothetical protein